MVTSYASLPLTLTDARSLLFNTMNLDSTKCPYCQAPTIIREVPEYEDEREGIYFPCEIVITCTGVHKGIDPLILQKYTQDDPDIVTYR